LAKSVERHLMERIGNEGAIHMTLLDPEKTRPDRCAAIAHEAECAGTAAIMVGGSTLASNSDLDEVVKDIKATVGVPVILFPNNIAGVSRYADAIWFMSLLNSSNTYYLIDVQALTALLVRQYGLETISLGYIIVGDGGAAGYIGQARPLSYEHPEIVLGYSLAAETLGMHFVYLEAGSGAKKPVPPDMIKLVKKYLTVPLIVGGGIRDASAAKETGMAGANVIVTGSIVEETKEVRERLREIIAGMGSHRG